MPRGGGGGGTWPPFVILKGAGEALDSPEELAQSGS